MRVCYADKNFNETAEEILRLANQIIDDYAGMGLSLTLRQLYYQFVARDWFPDDRTWTQTGSGRWVRDPEGTKNAEPNYKWLGGLINDGRLAGRIDWDAIVDRTRNMVRNSHWADPQDIIQDTARQYMIDNWEGQKWQPEVWVEKEALSGVLDDPCAALDVPHFACRGYVSQSAMWEAAMRLIRYRTRLGRNPVIIHLGDHDPSGVDMTRDIMDRMALFFGYEGLPEPKVVRIALNMNQIRQYNPPPNPAKVTDSRAKSYITEHGNKSWELDALDPATLVALIRDAVASFRDDDIYEERVRRQEREREGLTLVATHWDEVMEHLEFSSEPEDGDDDE